MAEAHELFHARRQLRIDPILNPASNASTVHGRGKRLNRVYLREAPCHPDREQLRHDVGTEGCAKDLRGDWSDD